jgi:hypothetical protein
MKTEQTECSEMSAYKIQMLGNYLEENVQHTEHGESLKSRKRSHTSLGLQAIFHYLILSGTHPELVKLTDTRPGCGRYHFSRLYNCIDMHVIPLHCGLKYE